MGDFLELAAKRQSCRSFSDKPVEREKLLKCVEAARLAPSACNSQPWSVVVVEDPKVVPLVAEGTMQLGANSYIKDAKAFFVVVEETAKLMPAVAKICESQVFARGDLGGFALSLTLEAESLGLGTCILGLFDRPRLRELLNIPAEKNIFLVVAAGYPRDGKIREKSRKPLDEICRFV
ncbi:MAG: nitroreductase family protein [Deltaproteobacteria bacterium]|jgi:nitroreductase|nr:nitroreductase family protein [Deltaproteobacteria bacterium]